MMLKAAVTTQVRAGHWAKATADRFRRRCAAPPDRGQTAVEYLGIVAVIVLIIGAIVGTDIGTDILNRIKAQIAKIAP
jgi:pilus assembly protein Flp/PilA